MPKDCIFLIIKLHDVRLLSIPNSMGCFYVSPTKFISVHLIHSFSPVIHSSKSKVFTLNVFFFSEEKLMKFFLVNKFLNLKCINCEVMTMANFQKVMVVCHKDYLS